MAITSIQDTISSLLARPQSGVSTNTSVANTNTVSTVSTDTTASTASTSSTPATVLASASLQSSSVGLAQLGSVLEAAQLGTQGVGSLLQQLQNLAVQASNGGPPSALASLDTEFQALITQINQQASGASVGGVNLLDGSQSDSAATNLTSQSLFNGTTPNLLTVDAANSALASIATAQNTVSTASDSIISSAAQVNFAVANVNTAIANNNASTSTLTDADLSGGDSGNILGSLLSNLGNTSDAQTGNLPASLLNLLQE